MSTFDGFTDWSGIGPEYCMTLDRSYNSHEFPSPYIVKSILDDHGVWKESLMS